MKGTFRQYQDYLIEEVKSVICKDLAEKTYTGEKKKGWKKEYEASDEYKAIVEETIAKSRKIKNINSLNEQSKQYKYFIENENAIIYLLNNNQAINNLNVENYYVNTAVANTDFSKFINDYQNYKSKVLDRITKYFTNEKIGFYEEYYEDDDDYYYSNNRTNYAKRRKVYLSEATVEQFIEQYDICKFSYNLLVGCTYCESYFKSHYRNATAKLLPKSLTTPRSQNNYTYRIWERFEKELNYHESIIKAINEEFTVTHVLELLKNNPNYKDNYTTIYNTAISLATLQENILNSIPDNYADLFPNARKMYRHFILHIGPTNSGKTYGAIERLKQATSGVYLAPLRLLAYEQFDNLNKQNIPCSLLTGEESVETKNATHIASTIEMLDTNRKYDVGVIDEGQMLADRDRGHAWTTAIMALQANEIHVCASKDAENILIKLITDCNDTYEVIHTERQVPIEYDSSFYDFPRSVKTGDALIVFSRKDVHSVASVLNDKGIKCSMIYGSLPYDVRHKEAEKFTTGQTKVIVATDAIGMGLNMPIKRVVFLKTHKFDGVTYRELQPTEIQQIAGRAGRYGLFNIGYYSKLSSAENTVNVKKRYAKELKDINYATISMPKSLIDLDVSLSKILEKWQETSAKMGYIKANIEEELRLCRLIEVKANGKKHTLYDLITIPFSSNDQSLQDIWFNLANAVLSNKPFNYKKFLPYVDDKTALYQLESAYRECDLLYYFNYKFYKIPEVATELYTLKKKISQLTMDKLDKGASEKRLCSRCGEPLPWNHRYNICEDCYYGSRPHYNRYWDEDEDDDEFDFNFPVDNDEDEDDFDELY